MRKFACHSYKEYSEKKLEIISYFKNQVEERIYELEKNNSSAEKPSRVNALYYSAYATSRETKITEIIDTARDTEVNALVIDIKEIDGKTSFAFDHDDFGDDLELVVQKI